MKQSDKLTIPTGILFLAAAAVILISIFLQFINFGSFRVFPLSAFYNFGRMLFSVYGFSSFLIPIFLFISAIMLFLPRWNTARGIYLAVSIIPFFTIAGLEYASKIILTDITLPMKVMKYTAVVFISALLVSIEYLVTGLIVDAVETRKNKKNPYVPVFEVNDEGNPIPEEILNKTESEEKSVSEFENNEEEKSSGEVNISEIDISDIASAEDGIGYEIPEFATSAYSHSVPAKPIEAEEVSEENETSSFVEANDIDLKQPDTITRGQIDELSAIVPGFKDEEKTEPETEENVEEPVSKAVETKTEETIEQETVEKKMPVVQESSEEKMTAVDDDPENTVKTDEIITIDFNREKKSEPQIITLDFNSADAPEMRKKIFL